MYRHTVIYIGRTKVFTDRTFTEKIDHQLRSYQEEGWELVEDRADHQEKASELD